MVHSLYSRLIINLIIVMSQGICFQFFFVNFVFHVWWKKHSMVQWFCCYLGLFLDLFIWTYILICHVCYYYSYEFVRWSVFWRNIRTNLSAVVLPTQLVMEVGLRSLNILSSRSNGSFLSITFYVASTL